MSNTTYIERTCIIEQQTGQIPDVTECRPVLRNDKRTNVDTIDMGEGVCNGFLPYTRFLGFLEFSGYHQWQQESQ